MKKIYNSIEELIGHTPLLRIQRFSKAAGVKAELLAKLEYFNPAGSVKDRAALRMIEDAEAAGILKPNSVIIEPTSGNTGVGLAAIVSAKGYRTIIVMPETMSEERRLLIKAHGAELILTDGKKGVPGAIEKAKELAETIEHSWMPGQFSNFSNVAAHYSGTGYEIWEDTEGSVDIFVSGVGTGGTLTGVGRYLKERNPGVYVVAVEPAGSPVLSGGKAGPHKLQGIGAGFIPEILERKVYDEVLQVEDEDALRTGRLFAKKEGLLTGISSGAALWAAATLGKRPGYEGKRIVVLLPDTGERYLSTPLFKE